MAGQSRRHVEAPTARRRVGLRLRPRPAVVHQPHDRPILLGEFGAYDKADMESTGPLHGRVARTAEWLGWSWAYWQFDSDFVLFDVPNGTWVTPLLQGPRAVDVAS